MKNILSIIAAVLLVGCGESQQSAPQVEPVAEVSVQPSPPPAEAKPVAEATKPTTPPKAVTANKGADPARGIKPEPPTAKAPDISIHQAANDGNIEAVKQALNDGADVNAKEDNGFTPLHEAANQGHKEIVELLIAKGANVNAKDEKGYTPLDQSALWGHKEIFYLLSKHGGKTKRKLEAAGKPTEPVAEAAQPEPQTAKTADASLWEAAMFGKIEAAKKAIADGANVNAKKEDGQTPLHFAVVAALDSGDNKVIELLIENGADVNAKIVSGRHQGMTPLDITGGLSEAASLTKRLRELQGKTDDIPVADLLRKHGGKTGEELKAEGK